MNDLIFNELDAFLSELNTFSPQEIEEKIHYFEFELNKIDESKRRFGLHSAFSKYQKENNFFSESFKKTTSENLNEYIKNWYSELKRACVFDLHFFARNYYYIQTQIFISEILSKNNFDIDAESRNYLKKITDYFLSIVEDFDLYLLKSKILYFENEFNNAYNFIEKAIQILKNDKSFRFFKDTYVFYKKSELTELAELAKAISMQHGKEVQNIVDKKSYNELEEVNNERLPTDFKENFADILDFKARVCKKIDKYEEAVKCYLEIIALETKHSISTYLNLTKIYFDKLNNNEKAKYFFGKACKLAEESDQSINEPTLDDLVKNDFFVTKIELNSVRHFKNKVIELGETKKHLILTGANGSGKTTVLRICRSYLKEMFEKDLNSFFSEETKNELFENKKLSAKVVLNSEDFLDIRLAQSSGRFLLKYFETNRGMIEDDFHYGAYVPINSPLRSHSEENLWNRVASYLSNQNYKKILAKTDSIEYKTIEDRFVKIKNIIKEIDNHFIDFDFSVKDNYPVCKLIIDNKGVNEKISFDELPGGYAASLRIVFETLLANSLDINRLNLPGVIFIDEPELFLHVRLQKKIMQFLTTLFPNVQFIVATHSPYVVNSLSNAIVLDLGTHQRLDNADNLSAPSLIKYHFNMESEESPNIEKKMKELETIIEHNKLNIYNLPDNDANRILDLIESLDVLKSAMTSENYMKYENLINILKQEEHV